MLIVAAFAGATRPYFITLNLFNSSMGTNTVATNNSESIYGTIDDDYLDGLVYDTSGNDTATSTAYSW